MILLEHELLEKTEIKAIKEELAEMLKTPCINNYEYANLMVTEESTLVFFAPDEEDFKVKITPDFCGYNRPMEALKKIRLLNEEYVENIYLNAHDFKYKDYYMDLVRGEFFRLFNLELKSNDFNYIKTILKTSTNVERMYFDDTCLEAIIFTKKDMFYIYLSEKEVLVLSY